MIKISLIIQAILVSLLLCGETKAQINYVDSRDLYRIEIPDGFFPQPKLIEHEEIHFVIPGKSTNPEVPAVFTLITTKIDSVQTLTNYIGLKLMLLLKDKNNYEINGTKEYSTDQFSGQVLDYKSKSTCTLKNRAVFIKSDQWMFEFLFSANENDFEAYVEIIDKAINSFKILEFKCLDSNIAQIGVFKTNKENNGFIERTKDSNIEYFNNEKTHYIKTNIKWVSKCEFQLEHIEHYPNEIYPFKKNDILKIRILNTGEDWYECIWEIAGLKGYEKYYRIK